MILMLFIFCTYFRKISNTYLINNARQPLHCRRLKEFLSCSTNISNFYNDKVMLNFRTKLLSRASYGCGY